MQSRQGRLDADVGFIGIDADRQIIQCDLDDIVPDLLGIIIVVGEGLIVCDQDVDLVEFTGILQFDAALQRPHIMAQMQFSGRTVAGQNDLFLIFLVFHTSSMPPQRKLCYLSFTSRKDLCFHPKSGPYCVPTFG